MGGVERAGHLLEQAQRPLGVEGPGAQQLRERRAVDQPHGQEQLVPGLSDLVHVEHVGVLERGLHHALAADPVHERGVLRQLGPQDLQRDPAVERDLHGLVHHAHPAAPEHALDAIAADHRADLDHTSPPRSAIGPA